MEFIRKDADVSSDHFYLKYIAQFQDIGVYLEAVLLHSL